MALGKNLKKKELIPEKKESSAASQNPETLTGPDLQADALPGKASPVSHSIPSETKARSTRSFISKEEHAYRQKLQAKFDEELIKLAGKKVQLIVFRLGNEEYALDIARTREVVVTPSVSKVPHVPSYIKGVTNIRGSVILVFDLAEKFHLRQPENVSNTYTLVIESDRYKVGILLNEVPLTLKVNGEDISSSSGLIAETTMDETYIKGVIKLENRMIFFIDIDELIEGDKLSVIPEAIA